MKFCYLPKDEKTFAILKLYVCKIKEHANILEEDNKLQVKEIREHNEKNHTNETLKWIEDNGKAYRNYLNSIKELAVIFIITNYDVDWENFIRLCDKINDLKDIVLEKIF